MANVFQHVGINKPKRTKFDGGHEVKLSTNFAALTPILCEPVVPGDVFRCNTELFLRFAPLQAPIMHRINVFTHFFFVPSRLLWDDFKEFITGGEDGTSMPVYPRYNFPDNPVAIGSLLDYLGFPIGMSTGIDALPLRAYQLIYNEYYRDQNLEEPVDISLSSGIVDINDDDDELSIQKLRYRCFEKDYFTSALPFAQRGPSAVIPFAGASDINIEDFKLMADDLSATNLNATLDVPAGSTGSRQVLVHPYSINDISGESDVPRYDAGNGFATRFSAMEGVATFPNGVNATTINDLRKAIQLQKWLERNARGGARYIEQILSHFGVVSSDARLQRPEYLGGGMSPVSIQGVVQNSATEGESGTPQGNLSGMATAVGNTHQFTKYFEEHGYVIGIMSIMPRTSYQQGLPRKYQKFDKFDYYWPEFAHIGEQEVYNSELYYQEGSDMNQEVFGYQSRYAEYKSIASSVHGDFRDTLNFWHAGRIFGNAPQLNADFVHLDPSSLDRIWAVGNNLSNQKIYVELYNDLKMIRPMPLLGEPGWMDHF